MADMCSESGDVPPLQEARSVRPVIETTPSDVTPRTLKAQINTAKSNRLDRVRRLAVATSDLEREQLRLEIAAKTTKIDQLTERREALLANPVSFERR
jgi:hypothetical protein